MINASLKRVLSAALGLALVSAAAPMALADSPGYLFQDFGLARLSVPGFCAAIGGQHQQARASADDCPRPS